MSSNTSDKNNPEEEKQDSKEDLPTNVDEMEVIRENIAKNEPMISDEVNIDNLLKVFDNHSNFKRQAQDLISKGQHKCYRQMRADGNCFYRAFILALFETILNNNDTTLLKSLTNTMITTVERLLKFGFERYTLEEFYEAFMDELQWVQRKLENNTTKADDTIGTTPVQRMSDNMNSQYLIFWFRMLASLWMRENESDYLPFVQGTSMDQWLKQNVEALNSEADQPQCVALASCLNLPIRLYAFENTEKGGIQVIDMPEGKKPIFDLIYRPGHYDVLYRQNN